MLWLQKRILPTPALVDADPALTLSYRLWANLRAEGRLPPRCAFDTPHFRLVVPEVHWLSRTGSARQLLPGALAEAVSARAGGGREHEARNRQERSGSASRGPRSASHEPSRPTQKRSEVRPAEPHGECHKESQEGRLTETLPAALPAARPSLHGAGLPVSMRRGEAPTARRMIDILDDDLRLVRFTCAPLFVIVEFSSSDDRFTQQVLVLPFADDGRHVSELLVVTRGADFVFGSGATMDDRRAW